MYDEFNLNSDLNNQTSTPERETASTAENTNLPTCYDPDQSSKIDKEPIELSLPAKVKPTVLQNGYYLVVLCLCWQLRNLEKYEGRYSKIQKIADLNTRSDIFKCLENINKGNSEGALLLRRMKGIIPIVLAAGISLIDDVKDERKLIPHYFCSAIKFVSATFSAPIKEVDIYFRTLSTFDYQTLRMLYKEFYHKEDDTFEISNAITSLFTDIVLYTFMDCQPNFHMASSGSKGAFAKLINVGELEIEIKKGILKKLKEIYNKVDISAGESCARSALWSLVWHKLFKRLYLNDADPRFYNFLLCMKEYPLYVVSEILICNADEELKALRQAAKAEAIAREQAEKRGEKLEPLPDGSSLVKIRDFMAKRCNYYVNSVRDRVRSAAWLFLWVNMSFSGNFDSGISKDRIYIKNINQYLSELLSAALVLQKAEISCMDCVDFMKRFIDERNHASFIDPPFVLHFGAACKTYSIRMPKDDKDINNRKVIKDLKPFGIDKIKELFSLAAKSKGKVLITHSAEHEVKLAANCVDLDYLFSYTNKANGNNENAYQTIVFSKNITEEGFIRHNKDGSLVSPAFIDNKLLSRFNRRAEKVREMKAADSKGGEVL